MKTLSLICLALCVSSCSSVKSDLSYQKGKEAYWNGSYDQAITYLNNAIELSPTTTRNYHQLALTYERIGHLEKAWESIRKAYALDRNSRAVCDLFTQIYSKLSDKYRLDSPRKLTAKRVIEILGVADTYLHNDQEMLQALYYGPLCLHIDGGLLKDSELLRTSETISQALR